MYKRVVALVAVSLLWVPVSFAKGKPKATLSPAVLQARTVAVIIDPNAGMSIDDPNANRMAQKDVETALLNWGRFETAMGTPGADLIIVVRKGTGRRVNDTITDPNANNRPGVINPTDNGIGAGAQHGSQPDLSREQGPRVAPGSQLEIGESDDSFAVYQGGVTRPLDSPPVWRYVAPDGLRPHSVPAVAEFRKAIAEAEKAAAKKP